VQCPNMGKDTIENTLENLCLIGRIKGEAAHVLWIDPPRGHLCAYVYVGEGLQYGKDVCWRSSWGRWFRV